jgi:hypothetical protein
VSQQLPVALLEILEHRYVNTRFTQLQLLVDISLGAVGSEEIMVSQLLLESSPVVWLVREDTFEALKQAG